MLLIPRDTILDFIELYQFLTQLIIPSLSKCFFCLISVIMYFFLVSIFMVILNPYIFGLFLF